MAGGIADVVEVVVLAAGAHAALCRRGTHVRTRISTEEHVLERHHAGVGEEKRRVVFRHQGGGRHDGVSALLEESQESLSDICTFHKQSVAIGASTAASRPRGDAKSGNGKALSTPLRPSQSALV